MRSGLYTVQQALAPEAAAVVKQAVALARRRGHAQVTPLHVASAMLSSPAGILRTACLRAAAEQQHLSQNPFPVQYPFQCKALDLCFNVALNRLPAASSSAVPFLTSAPFHPHHYPPPPLLSNALVAAFKRAQANQRRGASDQQQQQAVVAPRIEVEQLVVSILDDPSVSRVMREAGFSSTQLKADVERSFINSSRPTSPATAEKKRQSPSSSPPRALDPNNHKSNGPRRFFNSNVDDEEDEVVLVDAVTEGVSSKRFRNRGMFGSLALDFHPDLTVEHAVPASTTGSLDLKLSSDSDLQIGPASRNGLSPLVESGDLEISQLNCCTECTHMYYKEAAVLGRAASCYQGPVTSDLPSWFQQYKEESRNVTSYDQEKLRLIKELRQKWNSICQATHNSPEESSAIAGSIDCIHNVPWFPLSSSPPTSNASVRLAQTGNSLNKGHVAWLSVPSPNPSVGVFSTIDFVAPDSSASSSSSEAVVQDCRYQPRFSGLSSENLNRLCDAMEKAAPMQSCLIPEIASTILQCRSGMRRRRGSTGSNADNHNRKRETWMLFRGSDVESKERVGHALSELVFARRPVVVKPGEGFTAALTEDPCRMFWVEIVEDVGMANIIDALATGRLHREGGTVELEDAIIIICCSDDVQEESISGSRVCFSSPARETHGMDCDIEDGEGTPLALGLDLNLSTVDSGDSACRSMRSLAKSRAINELLDLVDGDFFFQQ